LNKSELLVFPFTLRTTTKTGSLLETMSAGMEFEVVKPPLEEIKKITSSTVFIFWSHWNRVDDVCSANFSKFTTLLSMFEILCVIPCT
jgi:hypothetical protein